MADKAPKVEKSKGGRPAGKRGTSYKAIQDGLESTLVGLGVAVSAFDPHCGGVLVDRGPSVAAVLTEAARQNPTLKRVLAGFVTTSVMAQVVGAVGSLLLPIMAHHGFVPQTLADTVAGVSQPVEMETRGTRHSSRADRSGKDDARTGDSSAA